jgi:quinol monooxygenase YgiN
MYVVAVDFAIKPERLKEFMPLMLQNARQSSSTEPGCRQFDVCADPSRREAVFLYEVYDDRKAYEAHLATTHFKSFDTAAREMIAARSVRFLERFS